jgi:tRNA G18 (ribose-2'-O)-methylase SpoU
MLIRTTVGLGFPSVVYTPGTVDPWTWAVVRATTGAIFWTRLVEASWEEFLTWCLQRHIQTVATTPRAERWCWEIDFRRPTMIFLGNESEGLDQSLIDRCEVRAGIPMFNSTDSLNVSVAAAMFLYEAKRQRQ